MSDEVKVEAKGDEFYEKGWNAFHSGLYCAESVLSVIAEDEGLQSDLIPGIATGFCGGMSRTGNVCGAVTGGILALNLVFGRKDTSKSAEKNYAAVQELVAEFTERTGSLNCTELLQCNLGTEEGRQQFKEQQLREKCKEFTGIATSIVKKIIDQKRQEETEE